jgi:hypothetical protein
MARRTNSPHVRVHPPEPTGVRSWYTDPHGFAERASTVRRRRHWYARVAQRLMPEATIWGWADVDGARSLQEVVTEPAESVPEPEIPALDAPKRASELGRRRIHPPFTAE